MSPICGVFLILIVVDIILGIILLALPLLWRNGISTLISGTLIAPFLALVVTLIYYRLVEEKSEVPPAPGGYAA
jgi:hypothetical protein